MKLLLTMVGAAVLICPIANAAVVASAALACKGQGDAIAADELRIRGNWPLLNRFQGAKISGRDCILLSKGLEVELDQKVSAMMCVRLVGSTDCYWAPVGAIDLNPPVPDATPHQKSRRQRTKF